MKFRKKPVVIEAEQFFEGVFPPKGVMKDAIGYYVTTIHRQTVYLENGDWIIQEPDDEHFYPCKPDIFQKTYEPI